MAATRPVTTTPRALGRSFGRVVRWSLILFLLLALAGVVAMIAFGRSYDGRVLPGVVLAFSGQRMTPARIASATICARSPVPNLRPIRDR